MDHSKFMTAMCDEVRRQGGEHIYYSVVTLEQPAEGEGLYHMEKVDFQPGNPGHDCYSTAKAITSIAVGKYTASLPLAYKIAHFFGLTIEEVFDFSDLED